jgi:tetratricopeptide (TPR) repeat protein
LITVDVGTLLPALAPLLGAVVVLVLDVLDTRAQRVHYAIAFIALVLGTGARPTAARGGARRLAGTTVFVAGAAAACAALALPYVSLRYLERARAESSQPAAAYRDLDRAAALDPLSVDPALSKGVIAVQAGQPRRARAAFREALTVEEHWLPHFELALLDASRRRFAAARGELARAERLNAMDPIVEDVGKRVARRERIDPAAINRSVLQGALYERRGLK